MEVCTRFIHTADLHLGSILQVDDNEADEKNKLFKNAVYDAFKRICDEAIRLSVDFIVISGDVYDRDSKSVRANSFFNEQCKSLEEKNIKVYIAAGNHDPLENWREIFKVPKNVYICDSEKCSEYEVKNIEQKVIAKIYGQSYGGKAESRKLYNNYNAMEDNIFNIGLLHTQMDNSNNYVPCTAQDLKARDNFSYWALGHIHKLNVVHNEKPIIAYPGIPQGRDSGEQGLGGCLLVEVHNINEVKLKLIPTSAVIWKTLEVKIDDNNENIPQNLTELIKLIEEKARKIICEEEIIPSVLELEGNIEDVIKGYVINWVITGRGQIYDILKDSEDSPSTIMKEELNQLLSDLNPFIHTGSVDLRIGKPILNIDKLKDTNEIFGEVHNVVNLCGSDSNLRKELIQSFGQVWEAQFDPENINYTKLQLQEDVFEKILNKAQDLIIEKLMEEVDSDAY